MRRPLLALLVVVILAPAASSQMPLEGSFTAARDCPAYQSIKKQTNPDGASVHTGQSYRLIAKNKETASHYLVEIEGDRPGRTLGRGRLRINRRGRRSAAACSRRR